MQGARIARIRARRNHRAGVCEAFQVSLEHGRRIGRRCLRPWKQRLDRSFSASNDSIVPPGAQSRSNGSIITLGFSPRGTIDRR